MECEECGEETKVCFRSNNKRYKLYICRGCKLKEDKDTPCINKANNGGENNGENG